MATNTYVVRLIDCDKAKNSGVNGDADDVRNLLKIWFTQVCQKASTSNATWNADVQWLDSPPSAKPSNNDFGSPFVVNLMIYFVTSPRDSVISLSPRNKGKFPDAKVLSDADYIGYTWSEPVSGAGTIITISEVYVRRCRDANDSPTPLQLARSGFHESMHNQLALGDELHKGSGFAGARIDGNSPSADNIAKMAAGLATLRPQWVEGFQAWKTNEETVH